MKIESEYIIRTKEFNEILKKYDFVMIAIDGVFGFYPDETSNYFCKVGSFYYSLDTWNMKVRVFDSIKFKHDKIVGCSDKSTLCKNVEDIEKCLQNISAQRKKLLVYLRIKNLNKDFKKENNYGTTTIITAN